MNLDLYVEYLTHLLRCAVTQDTPNDMPEGIDAKTFCMFCRFHKVDNIAYEVLKHTNTQLPEDVKAEFERFEVYAITIDATQQYYLEETEKAFEENGIDYLVLKGRELEKLYPEGMIRQSSDFDIYIGVENAARAKDIMLHNGYAIEAYSDDNDDHDEYTIDGNILCELHRVLIQNDYVWREECNKIPERLILCEGTKHKYRMDAEDFYLYNLAHAAKHMKFSGIGIRAFFDLWIIKRSLKIDADKLKARLEGCSLTEFEENTNKLCEYWFEGKAVDKKTKEMSRYAGESGWVGTYEQAKATELAETAGKSNSKTAAKIKRCMQTIFASYEAMAARYPIIRKHKWLTPFCRIHRAIRAALFRRDVVKSVTDELGNADMDMGKSILRFKESIGL